MACLRARIGQKRPAPTRAAAMRLCLLAAIAAVATSQSSQEKPDWYELLGVSRDATPAAVKRAYRNLALAKHPDKNPGREQESAAELAQINNAFEVLKDEEKRAEYDEYGHETPEERMKIDPRSLFQAVDSDVTMLHDMSDFAKHIKAQPSDRGILGERVWIVDYYMKGCGPCHAFAPEFKRLAARLRGVAHAAAVACGGRAGQICEEEEIHGFPTLMLYRWRYSPKRRRWVQDAVRFSGDHKLAPALAWAQTLVQSAIADAAPHILSSERSAGRYEYVPLTALHASALLERPAERIAESVRSGAAPGNVTLLHLYDSTDRGVEGANEVRLAAAALGPLAHHLLVDCAPAESAVTPPLCASLSPSGHVPHTRLFHAGDGEGGAGTPFDGKLTASALIEWAAALMPTPLTSKAAASAPMDHAVLAVVADLPLPPMDALLVSRLEHALRVLGSGVSGRRQSVATEVRVVYTPCSGSGVEARCSQGPVLRLRQPRHQSSGASCYVGRLRHHAELYAWVQRELSSRLAPLQGASFEMVRSLRHSKRWLVLFREGACAGCGIAAAHLSASLGGASSDGKDALRGAVVDCAIESELCDQEEPTSFPSARLYYEAQDGQVASEAVAPDAWGSRQALEREVRLLVSSPVRRMVTIAHYRSIVQNRAQPAFVVYTAGEWCGPCAHLRPQFRQAAVELESHGIVTATADCDGAASELCQQLKIDSYPYIVFYPMVDGKSIGGGIEFDGPERQSSGLVAFALRGWKPTRVKHLTRGEFASSVDPRTRKSSQGKGGFAPHLLLFTAGRWCGPCMHLEPTYKDVASLFAEDADANKLVVARVDCDRLGDLCTGAGVDGFPHMVFVPAVAHPQTAWQDSSMEFEQANRERDAPSIFQWAKGLFEATQAPHVGSVAELERMRVKQLKKLVLQHGLDCSICAEKGDFVAVIKHGLGLKDEL